MNDKPEETWAVVELMGHVKIAGRLTEEERFGAKMGRLDIPIAPLRPQEDCIGCSGSGVVSGQPCGMSKCGPMYASQYFGGGSIYRITIVSEAVARMVAAKTAPAPVSPWDFPKQLAAHPMTDRKQDDDNSDLEFA